MDKSIFEFTLNKAIAAIENDPNIETSKILSNLEGTLFERIETALLSGAKIGDISNWDSDTWLKMIDGNENGETAEKLNKLLSPIAQSMGKEFVEEFAPSSKEASDNVFKIFENDLKSTFSKTISVLSTIQINTIIEKQNLKQRARRTDNIIIDDNSEDPQYSSLAKPTSQTSKTSSNISLAAAAANALTARKGYAEGGILTKPHIGLVAEDGAEAIIPLSGKRRNRGISLWEKAGKLLGINNYGKGIKAHAEGGIFGNISNNDEVSNNIFDNKDIVKKPKDNISAISPITINLGGINITINSSESVSNDIMDIIRQNMPEISNEVASTIAKALINLFANMKAGVI